MALTSLPTREYTRVRELILPPLPLSVATQRKLTKNDKKVFGDCWTRTSDLIVVRKPSTIRKRSLFRGTQATVSRLIFTVRSTTELYPLYLTLLKSPNSISNSFILFLVKRYYQDRLKHERGIPTLFHASQLSFQRIEVNWNPRYYCRCAKK